MGEGKNLVGVDIAGFHELHESRAGRARNRQRRIELDRGALVRAGRDGSNCPDDADPARARRAPRGPQARFDHPGDGNRKVLAQMVELATQRPVLVILEDAHWIDPTSLDLLERMVTCASQRPLLLLVTSRPEERARPSSPAVSRSVAVELDQTLVADPEVVRDLVQDDAPHLTP